MSLAKCGSLGAMRAMFMPVPPGLLVDGTMVDPSKLQRCTHEEETTYKDLSDIYSTFPPSISDVCTEVVLLGKGPNGLESCQPHTSEWPSRMRMTVDAQYANYPRCCPSERLSDLTLDSQGNLDPWATRALHSSKLGRYQNTSYFELWPEVKCSKSNLCPLVVVLPGHGGVPWLMIQAQCGLCRSTLASVLLAFADVEDTTASFVKLQFETLVVWYMEVNSQKIDDQQVFLVSSSKGNEIAIQAALAYPHIFRMVAMAGMFRTSGDLQVAIGREADQVAGAPGRKLKSLQFHIGDEDHILDRNQFFSGLSKVARAWPHDIDSVVDIRVYPSSEHAVWYATWNALHEVIWTGRQTVHDIVREVPTTCGYGIRADDGQ